MYRKFDVTENLFLHSIFLTEGLFSSKKKLGNATIAISLLFEKYYPIMD
jgi:hypothetical protein